VDLEGESQRVRAHQVRSRTHLLSVGSTLNCSFWLQAKQNALFFCRVVFAFTFSKVGLSFIRNIWMRAKENVMFRDTARFYFDADLPNACPSIITLHHLGRTSLC
jgi:hypothetical protein